MRQCAGPDTVVMKLDGVFREADHELLTGNGFERRKDVQVVVNHGESIQDIARVYVRETDGARVYVGTGRSVRVEASIPRVLGLRNDQQAEVTASRFVAALEAITQGVMPETTAQAWQRWHLGRIDLAANFTADVPLVIGAYSIAKHPQVKCAPRQYFGESVAWYGKRRELIIYDKGLQLGEEPGRRGRVEARWKGAEGMDLLAVDAMEAMDEIDQSLPRPGNPTIPLALCQRDKASKRRFRRVFDVPINDAWFDGMLRHDVRKIDGVVGVPLVSTAAQLGYLYYVRHPEEVIPILHGFKRRTRYGFIRQAREFRLVEREVGLEYLIWEAETVVA